MAHEFGHAMQGRFGFAASGRSIQDETQADCFAGAWTAWVTDGKARHVEHPRARTRRRRPRVPAAARPRSAATANDSQAHGSYFDRVSAFYEGFDGGRRRPAGTTSAPDRLFTAASFSRPPTSPTRATRPTADIVDLGRPDAAAVLETAFPQRRSAAVRGRRR